MPELSQRLNEDETSITYISSPIYEIHTVEPKLFCLDTGAPYSCIGDKERGRIFRHSEGRSFPKTDSKYDFKFGDTLVRSRGMLELMLPTPGSTHDIPVILGSLDVEVPPLLGLDAVDGKTFFLTK